MQAQKSFVFCHLSYVLKFSFFLFLFSFFLLSSCRKSTEPIYNPQNLQLSVADVSCTEAWLKLKTQIAQKDSSDLKLQLYRNDSLIVNKPLTTADSVLYVDGLQPATSYAFTAKILNGSKMLAVSAKVEATTMDITSHNFTWQTFEFGGQGGSSSFYDVAIIDENDIWAVGEIYTENDKYNAAHWDGEKWELKKILFHTFCTHGSMFQYPARSVYVVNNTIFISSGSEITFIKNGIQIKNQCTPVSINKIWGTSDHDLYVVGNNGLIAHYDGRQWYKENSSTDINLLDIWGANANEIWTAGYSSKSGESIVLHKKNNFWRTIYKVEPEDFRWNFRLSDTLCGVVTSLWTLKSRKTWFTTSSGIYYSLFFGKHRKDILSWAPSYTVGYPTRIRGENTNNIFSVGHFGTVVHWNGLNWKHYNELFTASGLILRSVAVKDNLVVIVGDKIILGKNKN